ncbi:unnamed protein product [Fusarium graminearum]|nr:unnamed protein product [Fusarium graminearum]VTO94229.1 unnamed protein product [Fusarium graminearum]
MKPGPCSCHKKLAAHIQSKYRVQNSQYTGTLIGGEKNGMYWLIAQTQKTHRFVSILEFPLIYMSGKNLVDSYAVKKFGPSVRWVLISFERIGDGFVRD